MKKLNKKTAAKIALGGILAFTLIVSSVQVIRGKIGARGVNPWGGESPSVEYVGVNPWG